MTEFQWKTERFNPSAPMMDLARSILDEAQQTDGDLKAKLTKLADTKVSAPSHPLLAHPCRLSMFSPSSTLLHGIYNTILRT